MDEIKKTADIVSNMDFSRRKPVSPGNKQQTKQLLNEVSELKKKIDKLNLLLWHAVERNDYRSFTSSDAKESLIQIKQDIERIL